MKKRLPVAIALLMSSLLIGCNNKESGPSFEEGDTIFENRIIYDTSSEAYDVHVKLDSDKSISSITSGRVKSEDGDFGFKNKILTISGNFMSKLGSGEKSIVVSFDDNSKKTIEAIFATKVIKTALEFQAINDNLSGTYVLGNDIDLSSINNFEPLGRFYGDEQDVRNEYFHGILEGNGYSIKNAKVYYCSSTTSAEEVYNHNSLFSEECHQNGNNVGLFQIIGSSGIVRNCTFDNVKVRGRTIVGVIAGNCSGVIENCLVKENCTAQMGTHFYDNDCNVGGVVGIVAGSGVINNVISLTKDIFVPEVFTDYSTDYIGKTGNGWDHTTEANNSDPSWKYANVDRPLMNYSSGNAVDSGSKEIDSNNSQTNGVYAFAGKTWGTISSSYAIAFKQIPYQGQEERDVYFSQTHLGKNKPGSGATDLGTITDCYTKTLEELKDSSLYTSFDNTVWNIKNNTLPSLVCPLISSYISE